MNRMRKGLAALAAAVFFLSVGGVAQAVIGIPDDVPGSTLLFPFFKVNPTRTVSDTQDTLLVVTNTAGATDLVESTYAPNVAVHVTLWSAASIHVFDFTVILTPHDVWSCSLYDLIIGGSGVSGCDQVPSAPPIVRDRLLSEVNGTPTLVGYATADLVYSDPAALFPGQVNYPYGRGNVLIGHMYLVNLINGSSTGFNAVSLETDNPCFGHNALPVGGQVAQNSGGFYRTRCEEEQGAANCTPSPRATTCYPVLPYGDYNERIDGPNGDWAQTGDAGGFQASPSGVNVLPDSPLSLLVRYLSSDTISARTEVWLWKDRVTTGLAESINVAVYDEEERVHSVQVLIPREVNFAMTSQIITPGAPGGWFRVKYECSLFSSCSYNYATPSSAPGVRPPVQAVAYGVQFAFSADASLRWDAAFPAHRQYTNYLGVGE